MVLPSSSFLSTVLSGKPPNPAINLQLPCFKHQCFPRGSQKLWVIAIRSPPSLEPTSPLAGELKPQNSGLQLIHNSLCHPHHDNHNQNDHLGFPPSLYGFDRLKKSSFSEESNHSSSQNHPLHFAQKAMKQSTPHLLQSKPPPALMLYTPSRNYIFHSFIAHWNPFH